MLKIISGSLLSQGREELIRSCAGLMNTAGIFAYIVPTSQLQTKIKEDLFRKMLQMRGETSATYEMACFSPQIYLFDGFVNELLKDALAYEVPLRVNQQKIVLKEVIRSLVEQDELSFLQGMIAYEGFYQSLLKWLKEVKGAGITPDEWMQTSGHLGKERELGLIYQRYEEHLTSYAMVDLERNYERLIQFIQMSGQSRNVSPQLEQIQQVYVDGFFKLDQLHLRLLKALLEAGKDVVVHMYTEKERSELFLSSQAMLEQLRAIAREIGCQCVEEVQVTLDLEKRSQVLNHLCQNLFNVTAEPLRCDQSIQILHAPDTYGEVEMIGREIKQALLREQSLKLDEIAVVFRNVDMYHFYIEQVFTELGIPYKIALGTNLFQMPVFKLINKIYRIFTENWSRESVLEVLKSHYLYFGQPLEIERYEQLILEAGIIGGKEEWLKKLERFEQHLDKEQLLVEVTQLKMVLQQLFQQLAHLARNQSIVEHSKALWEFFVTYKMKEQIGKTRDRMIIRRDVLSLDKLEKLLIDMIQFGELFSAKSANRRKITALEFFQDLQQAAKESMIPEPEAQHDAVQILTPSLARGYQFKLVYIGGLVEGEFPWYGEQDWLFKPEERRALKDRGIHFTQLYERLEEERLFFLEVAKAAIEKLVLTTRILQTNETAHDSSFIQEVFNLYVDGSVCHQDWILLQNRGQSHSLAPLTQRELDERLLQTMWERDMHSETTILHDELAASQEIANESLRELHQRGEMVHFREGNSYSKYDGLLQDVKIIERLQRTYYPERVYSISQINDYAACPFQFFCKRVLHLDQVEEPTLRLEPLDLGTLYHKILFDFFQQFSGWKEEELEQALQRTEHIACEAMEKYVPGLSLPRGLWMIYQEEIQETLKRIIIFEYEEAAKQNYQMRPAYLEASFGLIEEYQEQDAKNYREPVVICRTLAEDADSQIVVKFGGKIDRIDMSDDGCFLIIYDYKLGRRDKGYEDMSEGIDIQLPIYIKAAQLIGGSEKEVLGAGYFSLHDCTREAGIWRDSREDLIPVTKRSKRCLNTEDWQAKLEQIDQYVIEYIQKIRRGDFKVNPMKCSAYCKFANICRYEHARNRRKESVAITEGGDSNGLETNRSATISD